MDGLADIGARNAAFAERFLRHEGIRMAAAVCAASTAAASSSGRVSGRARQAFLTPMQTPAAEAVSRRAGAASGGGRLNSSDRRRAN